MTETAMKGEFSVVQFFNDGAYEKVRESVDADEAVQAFIHYTTNVAATMGFVQRVILTDGDDCIAMEWVYGKNITFGLTGVGEAVFGKEENK
jgi:hypothetical protein